MKVNEVLNRIPGERLDLFATNLLATAQSLRDSNHLNSKESDIEYANNLLAITTRLLNICNKNVDTRKDSSSNRKAMSICQEIFSVLSDVDPSILDEMNNQLKKVKSK